MRRWIEPPETPVSQDLIDLLGGDRLAAQALARRGCREVEAARAFIDPRAYAPCPPEALPGMDLAVERLLLALRQGERVLVWGDFDVDGQTATALLATSLSELGGEVSYHVPVRAIESHGMSLPVLQRMLVAPEGAPGLILTCDTGIAAHASLAYARSQGIDVIVTDHHALPQEGAPPAVSVVTPRFLPPGHALSGLPGVGVAYKLAEALYRERGNPQGVQRHLDLVALGIVADVAQQTGDTRYLLQRGLEQLRSPQRAGLQAICERAGLAPERITEEQVGFILAPRLNALGRLGDANPAVTLLTTTNAGQARQIALQLEGLNARRQLLTSQVLRAALVQIEHDSSLKESPVLLLAHRGWEAGVIGIVASRLVELFNKPALLISLEADGLGRASARSVEGVDITAAIASQAERLLGFGGHKMAAGFSIREEQIPAFLSGIARAVAAQLACLPGEPAALPIDGYLDWERLDLDMAGSFERLAPFGAGNPPLILATRGLRLAGWSTFGRQREHLQLSVEDETGLSRRVVWWGAGDYEEENLFPKGRFDLAYTLRTTAHRGRAEISLVWEDSRTEQSPLELLPVRPRREILDYRGRAGALQILLHLLSTAERDQVYVWVEGEAQEKLRAALKTTTLPEAQARLCGRDGLSHAHTLVIWTAPPGRGELLAALSAVKPARVAVFGSETGAGRLEPFLKRLAGMVKHALAARAGEVDLRRMAAGLAQKEALVFFGLEWLQAMGHITIQEAVAEARAGIEGEAAVNGRKLRLQAGGAGDPTQAGMLLDQVKRLLEEARAYRAYFTRAEVDSIMD